MGEDNAKLAFFQAFVAKMRETYPSFGKACYVDSTPLPNDIVDNPFNFLCSHGVTCTETMSRLVLVLDEMTGLPVWYTIIPGNLLDISTLYSVTKDVKGSLGIEIVSYVLDAGYISKDLIEEIHIGSERNVLGRMPARKGFPFKELYWENHNQFDQGKYIFMRNGYAFWGKKAKKTIFGQEMYTYTYVDKYNALKHFSEYTCEHEKDYEELKDKDKDKNWMMVKNGFFVLVSNIDDTPKNILKMYYGRTKIETVFKTSKEYLELLPLSKWTDTRVRGKILHDIIDTIVLLELRKSIQEVDKGKSVTDILGKTSSLMCIQGGDGKVTIETPNKQARETFDMFKLTAPGSLDLSAYRNKVLI